MIRKLKFIIFTFLIITLYPISSFSDNNICHKGNLKIFSGSAGDMEMKDLIDGIGDKKIIYIGEFHDNSLHHKIQLEIIKRLWNKNHRLAVGMEMFQSRFQDIIDKYLKGKIDEDEFLEKTGYKNRWGFDYSLYKPIIDFCKKKHISLIALDIDSELIKKVSTKGISSLSSSELDKLPKYIDFTNQNYKKLLNNVFKEHPMVPDSNFSKFYSSQLVRDEEMAENINKFLKNNPDYQVVVLTGNGHIMYSYGIPSRAFERNKLEYVTIANDLDYEPFIADYIINTNKCEIKNNKEPAL